MPKKNEYTVAQKSLVIDAVNDRIEPLALAVFGAKNNAMSNAKELRFGKKGSKSVELAGAKRGSWFDHEEGEGGGGLDLIKLLPNYHGDPFTFAIEYFGIQSQIEAGQLDRKKPRKKKQHKEKTDAEKIADVVKLVLASKPVHSTQAAGYLAGRGICRVPPAEAFVFGKEAWHDYPCLIGIVRDRDEEIVGCQKIYLQGDQKAPIEIQKVSSGKPGLGIIKLPGNGPPVLAEGPETGLSIWQATGREVWILTGSFSQIRHLNITPQDYPELIIARDGEGQGESADKALRTLVRELENLGFVILVATPPNGQDFNDVLQRRGDAAVAEAVHAAMPMTMKGADLDEVLAKLGTTDFDNAMRFRNRYPDECLWFKKLGWHDWDGRRFVLDDGQRTTRKMHRVAKLIPNECQHLADDDDDKRKARMQWAMKSLNMREVQNALASAQPYCYAPENSLDSDPYLFNVRNGTIDLRTGDLRKHDKADRISKIAPVDYDPSADCPTWIEFLASVLGISLDSDPDPEDDPIAGIQRAVGYSLCGDVREKKFYILYGPNGNNGKSVFLNIIQTLIGDYALSTSADTFMVKDGDKGGGINNDVARLRAARFVAASETDKSKRLSENFIKQVTGRDMITARFLRKEFFEFRPQFKVWLASNHKPEIRGTDDALWMRPLIIPFMQKFWSIDDPDKPVGAAIADPDLEKKLRAELPGILAWAVQGCLQWQRVGLRIPQRWVMATKEYRDEMDTLGSFIDECCDVSVSASCIFQSLYEAYTQWCDDSGHKPLSKRNLGLQLNERGYEAVRGSKGIRRRTGLMLKPMEMAYPGVQVA